MKPQLLCTFASDEEIESTVDTIFRSYDIVFNKIFVLSLSDNDHKIITYNINPGNVRQILPNTISVHRKKDFNVFYTINALNALIKTLNAGQLDSSYPIEWEDYKNSILLTDDDGVRIHQTKIFKIYEK